jgi:hypothetical protein
MVEADEIRERTEEEIAFHISNQTKVSDAPVYSTGWLSFKGHSLQKVK